MVVRTPPASLQHYRDLTLGGEVPPGFRVAAFHIDESTGGPGPIYAATRQIDGMWHYVLADGAGGLIEEGALPVCARCHDEAPTHGLFGLPQAPRAPASSTEATE
jgi:hypothetical protein